MKMTRLFELQRINKTEAVNDEPIGGKRMSIQAFGYENKTQNILLFEKRNPKLKSEVCGMVICEKC